MRSALRCSVLLALALTSGARAAPPRIGINPAPISDWNRDFLYADALKHARPFATGYGQPGTGPVAVDADGWPTSDTTILASTARGCSGGRYTVRFTGSVPKEISADTYNEGPIYFVTGGAAVASHEYDAATNRTTLKIDVAPAAEGLWLGLRGTRRRPTDPPHTGFRDMTIMRPVAPGSEESHRTDELFSRQALEALSIFSIYRDLDHSEANSIQTPESKGAAGAMAVTWADRIRPSSPTQTGWPRPPSGYSRGIAIEHRIALANAMGADYWACWPDTADDDYKRKFCLACRYGTDGVNPYTSDQAKPVWPPLKGKLIIENSNELWNYAFPQAHRNLERSRAYQKANPGDLDWDGQTDAYMLAQRFMGRTAAANEAIARSVWGDSGFKTRYHVVLSGFQLLAPYTTQQALQYLDNRGKKPTNQSISLCGNGWYRKPKSKDYEGKAATPASVAAEGLEPADWLPVMDQILSQPQYAGIEQACYEGGAYFANDKDAGTAFTDRAQTNPAFAKLVRAAIDEQVAAGARHLVVYSSTQAPWQLLNGPDEKTIKYTATAQAIADLKNWREPPAPTRPRPRAEGVSGPSPALVAGPSLGPDPDAGATGRLLWLAAKAWRYARLADLALGAGLLLGLAVLAHDAVRWFGPAPLRRRPTLVRRIRSLAHAHPMLPLTAGFAAGVLAHAYWKRFG